MNLAKEFQSTVQNIGSTELFLAQLKAFGLVDVGQLEQIYKDKHTGLIRLYTENADKINAELCLPSGLGDIQAGQFGLVIYPRSPLEIFTTKVDLTEGAYSHRQAKFIPLQLAGYSTVNLGAAPTSINIGSKNYTCTFAEDDIQLFADNVQVSVDVKNKYLYAKLGDTQLLVNNDGVDVEAADEEVKVKAKNIKLDGDVVITGSLKVAEAGLGQYNFTVDKSQI